MEVTSSSVRVYDCSIQASRLSPKFKSKLHSSSSSYNLTSSKPSFPHKFCCVSASVKDSPKSVVAKMKSITVDDSEFELSSLTALSPLDGRYWRKVKDLALFMSEYGLTHSRYSRVILPVMDELIRALCKMAKDNAHVPMLSHSWTATPTTLGKEMAIFAARLSIQRRHLSKVALLGNWPRVAEEFVKSLGFSFNPYVTQIEPRDYMAELFNAMKQFNVILMDFDKDVWGYVSLGFFKQEYGCGTGNSLLAYRSALQGIGKLQVNEACLSEDLDQCWEVLAEPIQTVMRRYGVPEPYEKLKELTRGKGISKDSIREFILGLEIPADAKANLLELTPHTYISEATNLANDVDKFVDLVNGVHAL
ncbi:hypothetical protein MKX01_016390 [Papaver californicum]|nr:hypothetical protein MKX01_016390 [Papaver californicum]